MTDIEAGAFIDAVAPMVDLSILPEHRPGVANNLRMIFGQAGPLMALHLDDSDEIAPVFRA